MPVVRRPAVFWLALLVVLLSATACGNAGAGAARPAATASGAEASSATTTATTATTTAKAPSTGSSAAVAAEGYAALPQSKTPEGYYVLGDPNAPATMTFYSDFIWSACRFHVVETEPQLIAQYVKTGKARLIYRHLLQLGEPSKTLAEASECAGAQGKFWEMREQLYRRQAELYGATSFAAVQPLVAELGLDAAQFGQCMDQHQFEQQVTADFAAAEREGIRSRPVLDINGTRIVGAQPFTTFQQVLDAIQ